MCMVEGLPLQRSQDQISEWFSLGRFKNHWRQERKGGTYKIVRQRPATTYEQRHKNVRISQRMKVCRTRYCTMQLCCYASNDWEATRVEKGKLLKEIWSWNQKEASTVHSPSWLKESFCFCLQTVNPNVIGSAWWGRQTRAQARAPILSCDVWMNVYGGGSATPKIAGSNLRVIFLGKV